MRNNRLLKYNLFALMASFTVANANFDEWNAVGDAYISGDRVVVSDDVLWERGAIWNKTELNLSRDFDFSAKLFLGDKDSGADGFAFVLQNVAIDFIGNPGVGIGYSSSESTLAVEFDSFYNGPSNGDILNDHSAIHIGSTTNPVTPAYDLGNIEDGQEHTVRITWDASSQTITVYFNGVLVQSYQDDIVNNLFGGDSNVWFGFTGATGARSNSQYMTLIQVRNNFTESIPSVHAAGLFASVFLIGFLAYRNRRKLVN